jgi:Na+-transporting NADH:ubiquinone oxidoreductase subunit NqrF
LGIIILVVGLFVTIFTGFNLVTKKKIVDVGDLHISANQNHRIAWSPIIGGAVMLTGGVVLLLGIRKGKVV